MVRKFETGATRDTNNGKPDYEGFISPLVVERYGEYMHKHRIQSDGTLRDSDNWQKGIPKNEYVKSLWRHHQDHWMLHRGFIPGSYRKDIESGVSSSSIQEGLLCAIIFNTSGLLHELIKKRRGIQSTPVDVERDCFYPEEYPDAYRWDHIKVCPDTVAGDAPCTIARWSRWMWDWAWGKR